MDMRETFLSTIDEMLDADPRLVLVLAEISAAQLAGTRRRHPDRVLNVGIREQALVGVTGGLALAGLRPVAHSFPPFLVERPYEQVKLDLTHQGVGAVLVSAGASYDRSSDGRTHQSPGDVALLDTIPGWTVHVPGHPEEARRLLLESLPGDGSVYLRLSSQANAEPHLGAGFQTVRQGHDGVVLAVGPLLDNVLAATEGLDVTVLYAHTVRPFDAKSLRAATNDRADVVLVEPYLAGTSAHHVAEALADVPHRLLSLGVRRDAEVRLYGTPADHDAAHGLDVPGLTSAIRGFYG
ncbi:transketolase C-terminal domain-containing protein [Amycolatopsis bartoniae]|uniref:transketolase family protein n=1 Tax=Amycolatopsis bartoniae TaxID=941986 RepID=UPI0011953704|nr:transketolase C-terminal domain-containing protein [Amycolatopsis bartoniae]TVT07395.1 transketolase [Amycolatopsis bartoniae]